MVGVGVGVVGVVEEEGAVKAVAAVALPHNLRLFPPPLVRSPVSRWQGSTV
jgi:hypothetical protein